MTEFDIVLYAIEEMFDLMTRLVSHFEFTYTLFGFFVLVCLYRFVIRPILGGDFFGAKSAASDIVRSGSSDKADKKRK